MASKLKPCPCCGSKVICRTDYHRRTGGGGVTFYKIFCTNKKCFVHCGPRSDRNELRKSWNIRFVSEDKTEAVKSLVGE